MHRTDSGIEKLRKQVDKVDSTVLKLLGKRLWLVKRIMRMKKAVGKPLVDRRREREIMSRARKTARKMRAPPKAVEKIFSTIIRESRKAAWLE